MKVNKRELLLLLLDMRKRNNFKTVILDYPSFRDFCSFNKQDYPDFVLYRDLVLHKRYVIWRKKHIFVDLVNNVVYTTDSRYLKEYNEK